VNPSSKQLRSSHELVVTIDMLSVQSQIGQNALSCSGRLRDATYG